MASQFLGNAVDWLGRTLNIPERGRSESIAGGPTTTTGTDPRSVAAGWKPYTPAYQSLAIPANQSVKGWTSTYPSAQTTSLTTDQVSTVPTTTTTEVPTDGGGTSVPSDYELLQSELSKIYDPVFQALSNQEGYVGSEYERSQQDITGQYGVSQQSLQTEKASGERSLERTGEEAGTRKEDALTSATRLYNELTKGGQQRFGGASSAGEAFQSLTAVEQQRRQATIQSAYEGAMQKVGEYKANLEDKYATAVADLEEQKNSAMRAAQSEFNNAMLTLRNNRLTAESDKAQASLSMLQDLRNKVYTINLQSLQFAQQLAANKEMSLSYVDQYTQQVMQSLTGGQSAVSGMNLAGANQTVYGASAPTSGSTTTPYIGQISGGKKWDGTQWVAI